MARRRRRQQQNITATPFILLLGAALALGIYQSQEHLILMASILLAILLLAGIGIFLFHRARQEKLRRSGIAEIDVMDGLEFERYLQLLLSRKGFSQVVLTATYDLGVDLVARKDGHVWAIQAKRYKGIVGLDSVRQVVAAKNHYKCDKAMVITNSYFTRNAQIIAKSTDCVLVNRDGLIDLILREDRAR